MGVEAIEGIIWVETGSEELVESIVQSDKLGFIRIEADHGVFFKKIGEDIIILVVHVDNCAVTGSSILYIERFKKEMNEKYKLMDMGPANWLLGIKINHDFANKTLSLSQHAYINAII